MPDLISKRRLLWLGLLALLAGSAFPIRSGAQTAMTNTFEFSGIDLPIPDIEEVNFSGIQDTREISMDFTSILGVSVTLHVQGSGSGGFNGDLYAYLTKGDRIAILLNRPGRTTENPSGYGDNGLNVRFEENAINGDVHMYRLRLAGSHQIPLEFGEPLTSVWEPDGRHVSPELTLDTHPRTHSLDVFRGTDPNGEWTLFLADMEPGGAATLVSWGLQITAVPEPRVTGIALVGAMLLGIVRRKSSS